MNDVYILGGSQTDFSRNFTKEGKNVITLLKEVIDSGVEEYYQDGLFDLAFIYSEINRDDLAVPLWQQLAYLGNSTAQYNLGLCYAQGKGTNVDMNQARYWWQKAADQGDSDARRQLSNLNSRRW